MLKTLKVLIVEDHPLVVEGLKRAFEQYGQIQVVATAANASQCLSFLSGNHPDVILLDIMLPDKNGIDLCFEVKQQYPDIKILALSTYNHRFYIHNMIKNGASGYLLKNEEPSIIIKAIIEVANGNTYFSQEIKPTNYNTDNQKVILTKREIEVLKLIAEGLTNPEIAEKLFISAQTVETHRKNIQMKLGAKNAASMIKIAGENGYISGW